MLTNKDYCQSCDAPLTEGACLRCKKTTPVVFRCSGRDQYYQCAVVKPLIKFHNEYLCHKHYDEKRPKGFVDKLFDEKLSEVKKEQEHLGLTGYEYFQLKYGSLKNAISKIGINNNA